MASVRVRSTAREPAPSPREPAKGGSSSIEVATRGPLPGFIEPSLCQLVAKAPEGPGWVHEAKFDGYRLQARIENGHVTLLTRRGLDWTEKFGIIARALAPLPCQSACLDGELVVMDDRGVPNFAALKTEISNPRSTALVFYTFDLMHLDGYDLCGATLLDRKRLLVDLLRDQPLHGPLRYSEHFVSDGAAMLQSACKMGLEGVVSKRADGPYRSGRGMHWTKAKCSARQEFVIAGYVPATNSSSRVGSLVLGVYEAGVLQHVGRVGTGYTATVAAELATRLDAIASPASPLAERLSGPERRDVRWVHPEMVAEIELRGWTEDGKIRHGAFKGLREDKLSTEVVRERAPAAN